MNLTSVLNSSSQYSSLTSNGRVLGIASAGNEIYGSSVKPDTIVLFDSGNNIYSGSYANYSAFEYQYIKIENELSYFNNSGSASISTASRSIYSYNSSLKALLKQLSKADSGNCKASLDSGNINYYCKPSSPLQFYNAYAHIYNYTGQNKSYSYMGSEIKVS